MNDVLDTLDPELIQGRWNILRRRGEFSRHFYELAVSTAEGSLYLGLSAEGMASVLVPLDPARQIPEQTVESRNLYVTRKTISIAGRSIVVLELLCSTLELDSVFAKLVSDIANRIGDGGSAIASIESAVADFRRLLQREYRKQIDVEKAMGVVGELITLDRLSRINPDAWQAWSGPTGSEHDFFRNSRTLEVKATGHLHEPVVEISSLDQLQEPENGNLHLIHHVFSIDPEGPLSVPGLYQEILRRGADEIGFARLLELNGFDVNHPDDWEEHRFSLRDSGFYRVSEDFPRLLKASFSDGDLPRGVSHVTYRINLSIAREFKLQDEALIEDLHQKFAAG